jgi:hypothetical protein
MTFFSIKWRWFLIKESEYQTIWLKLNKFLIELMVGRSSQSFRVNLINSKCWGKDTEGSFSICIISVETRLKLSNYMMLRGRRCLSFHLRRFSLEDLIRLNFWIQWEFGSRKTMYLSEFVKDMDIIALFPTLPSSEGILNA